MARRGGRVLRSHAKLLAFPLLGGLAGVAFVVTAGTGMQLLTAVIVGGCGLVFGLLVGKALSGVARTALYVSATEHTAPEYFEDMDV
jgi:hypothetical protein